MTADLHARIKTAVDEARKTAEAATPGPWEIWEARTDLSIESTIAEDGNGNPLPIARTFPWQGQRPDAEHIARFDPSFVLRLCDHADDVLARHQPVGEPIKATVWIEEHHQCACGQADPCPEKRALATAWLGEGWDQ